ncbi:killer cell lectin-like receptor subfamily I member 1 [Meriones unguiculatus]|uniref:killer cell lectin-like receptor subfamily I member 1 n=1 Tax=Meriones unguiculatus TaxID=10047 RepID=UPI000B4EEEFF|nr:killer cell lectin-like receptor subfamily I member 1 [Meriones unguiculatus]
MPHSKHHEYTANKRGITYTEVKKCKSSQKQRIPTAKQSPAVLSEDQVNYAELTFQRTPQLPARQLVRGKRQGPNSTVWRVVTVILGALCVLLMTIIGILLPKLFSRQEEQSIKTSRLSHLCPKMDDCSWHHCSHDWIAFGNNFYRVFREIKTWADSQSACEELNSHLVEIDSKAELENLLLFEINGWIHLRTDEFNGSWLWENATKTQQTLINDSEKKYQSCYYLHGRQIVLTGCSSKKSYTCEFNI